jgi:serine/threonine protein kinase
MFEGSDLGTVISYPKIEGEHTPQSNKSAIGVIECLRRMHEDGNLHMDIKAGNCLFNDTNNGLSTLIDFDLSQPVAVAKYPHNYEHSISDGKRHLDAQPGNIGLEEHDNFALAEVLRREEAIGWELQFQWESVCSLVEIGQLIEAVDELCNQETSIESATIGESNSSFFESAISSTFKKAESNLPGLNSKFLRVPNGFDVESVGGSSVYKWLLVEFL